MGIKDLKIGKNYVIEPQDRYEDYLLEVNIIDITSKAIKWERVDIKKEDRHPSWVLASGFSKKYTIIEELGNA